MEYTKKDLMQSQIELSITVSPKEYESYMEKAAERLSNRVAVKGFRKGKTPYHIIKKEVGEMNILQEALESIIQHFYVEAVTKEKLSIVGSPQINIEKIAPGNDLVFKATVALLPEVKLADPKKLKVKREKKEVEEAALQETIDALRGMHAVEIEKDGKAEGTDKLIIDMDMKIDNVPVEGGQAKDYQVYLSENHYIPGFNEEVTGLKKGEKKEFTLTFDKNHYQKNLAGKAVDFEVTVKEVFERQLPEWNDELAKKLGQTSIAQMTDLIKSNMQTEADQKMDQKFEIDMLDAMIEKSTFSELPQVLIDAEKQKIFHELKQNLERSGVTIAQYLEDTKKKEEELMKDFAEQATKRAQAALLSRAVATEQNIEISEEELKQEIEMLKGMYADNETAQENLKRPEVKDSVAVMMQNRKVMAWLKEQVEGKAKAKEEKKSDKQAAKTAKKEDKKK